MLTPLLAELAGLGVKLAVEGDQLVMQAPRGVLTAELRGRVMARKPELLLHLAGPTTRRLDFSLFYFASEASTTPGDPYKLLLDGARYADQHGFHAVWVPERHFHALGGLFPNPAVAAAALATVTHRVQLRAGSIVLPLHDPLRVAEEWAMVDQLSGGRVGLSFASGWHADDFALAPERYAERKRHMLEGLETVRALWRGEAVERTGGGGRPVSVQTHPRPTRPSPPIWLTAVTSAETFVLAGEHGCNVLTCLLGQEPEELAAKIAAYRAARAAHGHDAGRVTCMVHAYLGDDLATVKARVRRPFSRYLENTLDLVANLARGVGAGLDPASLPAAEREALLEHAFERYWRTAALLGTPASVRPLVDQLAAMGVDELGCLVDFGLEADEVMAGLGRLAALQLAVSK
ncbi:MAG: non-ribosomal peptide synthetase [Cyanobacteria bacterium RYN_339]|nr:non-ribosomal peptide synthetase [Cyanobacteria bacterium RYN_339]